MNKEMDMNAEFNNVCTIEDSIAYADGATVSKIVLKKNNGSATLFSFDKGQNLSEHSTPYDALAVIVDGQCQISIAGTPHALSKGQMLNLPANIPHALEAIERFKMLLIMLKD